MRACTDALTIFPGGPVLTVRVAGLALAGLVFMGSRGEVHSAHWQVPEQPTPVATTPRRIEPVARPDLTLDASDLPPGYEEATATGMTLNSVPLEDRLIRRAAAGPGPIIVWSAAYQVRMPLTQQDVAALATNLTTAVTRVLGESFELRGWEELDRAGLGEHGVLYSFTYRMRDREFTGDGALLVFSRDDIVSYLMTMNADGRATVDLRQYGRLIDGRIARAAERAPSASATPGARQAAAPSPAAGSVVAPTEPAQASATVPGPAPGAASGPGRVLYRDDFANPNSGWLRQSNDPSTYLAGYEAGEYVVTRVAATPGRSAVWRREGFIDFQVEIDARLVGSTEGSYLALIFRRQENGDHYSFVVDPQASTFRLLRHSGPSITNVIGWSAAPAIQGGTASNRLGVRVRGSEIMVLVNGQELAQARDDTFSEGWVGFGVGYLRDGPAEGRFSNLVVTSVD